MSDSDDFVTPEDMFEPHPVVTRPVFSKLIMWMESVGIVERGGEFILVNKLPEIDVVYVLYRSDLNIYKIGHTKDLKTRIKTLQRERRTTLQIIAVSSGNIKLETILHRRMKHCRVKGEREWFDLNEEDLFEVVCQMQKCCPSEIDPCIYGAIALTGPIRMRRTQVNHLKRALKRGNIELARQFIETTECDLVDVMFNTEWLSSKNNKRSREVEDKIFVLFCENDVHEELIFCKALTERKYAFLKRHYSISDPISERKSSFDGGKEYWKIYFEYSESHDPINLRDKKLAYQYVENYKMFDNTPDSKTDDAYDIEFILEGRLPSGIEMPKIFQK